MTTPENGYRVCGYKHCPTPEDPIEGQGRFRYHPGICEVGARQLKQTEYNQQYYNSLSASDRTARRQSYRFFTRNGLTRQQLRAAGFEEIFDTWPASRTAQQERAEEEFQKARAAVAVGDRTSAIMRAGILQHLPIDASSAPRIDTRCAEIFIDAGEIGDPFYTLPLFERNQEWIERSWAAQRDYVDLVLNIYRRPNRYKISTYGHPRRSSYISNAMDWVTGAISIARWRCRREPRAILNILLHRGYLWQLRLIAFDSNEPENAQMLWEQMLLLAEEIDSAPTWIETLREGLGYCIIRGKFDDAQRCLEKALPWFSKLPPTSIARLSLCRPLIELFHAIGDKEKLEQKFTEYLDLCHAHPIAFHLNQANQLSLKCERGPLDLQIPGSSVCTNAALHLIYLEPELSKM